MKTLKGLGIVGAVAILKIPNRSTIPFSYTKYSIWFFITGKVTQRSCHYFILSIAFFLLAQYL